MHTVINRRGSVDNGLSGTEVSHRNSININRINVLSIVKSLLVGVGGDWFTF